MLRSPRDSFPFQAHPRKKVKLNLMKDPDYNEFAGQIEEEQPHNTQRQQPYRTATSQNSLPEAELPLAEQQKHQRNMFKFVKEQPMPYRKIGYEQIQLNKVKLEAEAAPQNNKKEAKSKKPTMQISKNWKKFLQSSSQKTSQKSVPKEPKNLIVSLDCEFVRSNQEEHLGRISIVDEQGNCIHDSYVRPEAKITDYLTPISGITYMHIRNALSLSELLPEIKGMLKNKIIVGHTVHKDLEVCRLKDWRGYKSVVDIASYPEFQEAKGRLTSLRNLAEKHLSEQIQQGRHSSVEDAHATMKLFKLHKKAILKHHKIIQ